jgi:hypothetical protein
LIKCLVIALKEMTTQMMVNMISFILLINVLTICLNNQLIFDFIFILKVEQKFIEEIVKYQEFNDFSKSVRIFDFNYIFNKYHLFVLNVFFISIIELSKK